MSLQQFIHVTLLLLEEGKGEVTTDVIFQFSKITQSLDRIAKVNDRAGGSKIQKYEHVEGFVCLLRQVSVLQTPTLTHTFQPETDITAKVLRAGTGVREELKVHCRSKLYTVVDAPPCVQSKSMKGVNEQQVRGQSATD